MKAAMPVNATPMMRQYRRIKGELPTDVILFFRMGDFYEMFFEDAQVAAPLLDVALTKRNHVPMCGVPYHAIETYLAKLVRAGRKVAMCEQVEAAGASRGVVRREVTRIVTPGTATEDAILETKRHHYLAALYPADGALGLAMLDLSTGRFWGTRLDPGESAGDALRRHDPTECLVPESLAQADSLRTATRHFAAEQVSRGEDWTFDYDAAHDFLVRHFGVSSMEGFGCEGDAAILGAAGAVLYYVQHGLHRHVGHIRTFRVQRAADTMLLDDATRLNLGLVPRRGGDVRDTLLHVLDVTRTPMGGRALRDWLLRPLTALPAIRERHEAVQLLVENRELLHALVQGLTPVRDLERLIARLSAGQGNARDLQALGRSLEAFPALKACLADAGAALLRRLETTLSPHPKLTALIAGALVDEPPVSVRDGGMIRTGYHAELDTLRQDAGAGRQWLAEYQAAEQSRTGIKTLKVRHNKVFGYYIEVSKAQSEHVPDTYARKQTLVNAERFITPELKEYETRILGAQGRAVDLEYELFTALRETAAEHTAAIQRSAAALADLDVLAALADRALALRYTCPRMTDSDVLRLKDSRHPIVEAMSDAERFVPNDVRMDGQRHQLLIITGPNMAGKSTFIRQVALVVIMAQMGGFVPASEAEIGVVDRIFTRVGASDDLARGRSTFMVEMQETANILNNATPSSLLVLDEIGRGTSTFDGISIAWAVAEHLHNNEGVKARTLFATHYHELTDLALTMSGVQNYTVQVREHGDRIVFLRKIVPGAADKSYGIHVARLAGMPEAVIDRAREILANLEEGEMEASGQPRLARRRRNRPRAEAQLNLFEVTPPRPSRGTARGT